MSKKQLSLALAAFFTVLALLAGILIYQAYSQLKWETFHQYRLLCQELAARVDDRFASLIAEEEARSFVDYAFLNVAGDPAARFVQRSPLAQFPINSAIPGMIGYFQVDAEGLLSTPLLPDGAGEERVYGISAPELQLRKNLTNRIHQILSSNQLVAVQKSGKHGTVLPRTPDSTYQSYPLEETVTDEKFGFSKDKHDDVSGKPTAEEDITPVSEKKQVVAQAAFDQLNQAQNSRQLLSEKEVSAAPEAPEKRDGKLRASETRLHDLVLADAFQSPVRRPAAANPAIKANAPPDSRGARQESNVLPELSAVIPQEQERDDVATESAGRLRSQTDPAIRITTFQSEIDPFEISLLESGHFVLFRNVWKEGQRLIQGMLIEQNPFLIGVIEPLLKGTAIASTVDLIVVYQDAIFSVFRGGTPQSSLYPASELRGEKLYTARLSAPIADLELIFFANQLPVGPGGTLIIGVAGLLTVVLLCGFMLMYWLGVQQIDLTRQQQDFVSAVSHELKTPLTSIRMYGEMLRDGWAPEEKIKTYYDYICEESERLTRLITNVLQLAKMTRNDLQIELQNVSVAELVDVIRSKASSQIERAGFRMNLTCEDKVADVTVEVDTDYFNQIVINLVDNAIKFAGRSEKKDIDISFYLLPENQIVFSVRDYGPGVPRNQIKKIFRLFYRSEDKFTQETKGTGIGLSLVNQLATAMNASVDVVNRSPGAEFRVKISYLPAPLIPTN